MKATNIIWDVDNKEDLKSLPTEVDIPEGMTDEEKISDYLSDLTGFCHYGFHLSTDPPDEDAENESRRENPKAERFRRVAEARTQKIIKMIRLLGNCSRKETYEYTPDQVEQIFTALNRECELSKRRFSDSLSHKMRFSLSSCEDDGHTISTYPTIYLSLPNGKRLRAKAVDDEDFPAINIDLLDGEKVELICFAELNSERNTGSEVCIGVYQSNQDDTVYYKPYQAEENSQ